MTAHGLTPVNVITGFLGSGKTTLLKAILASEHFGDSAILVNEFGEVGLDNLLLGDISTEAVLLQSGCVCCTIRGELSDALRSLLSQREGGTTPPFRRIILETTGLADPGPIASTITADPVLRHHVRPGATLTVVDALNGLHDQEHEPVWQSQVASADKVLISKLDLVDGQAGEAIRQAVRRANPSAEILDGQALQGVGSALFDAGPHVQQWRPAQVRNWLTGGQPIDPDRQGHLHGIQSFRLQFDRPLDWSCLGIWLSMLLNRHGQHILRVKGVIHVEESPYPVLLHGVQHTIHPPEHIADWPADDRTSQLIFITRGIGRTAVADSLATFMAHLSD